MLRLLVLVSVFGLSLQCSGTINKGITRRPIVTTQRPVTVPVTTPVSRTTVATTSTSTMASTTTESPNCPNGCPKIGPLFDSSAVAGGHTGVGTIDCATSVLTCSAPATFIMISFAIGGPYPTDEVYETLQCLASGKWGISDGREIQHFFCFGQ